MAIEQGVLVIAADAGIVGEVRSCRRLEVLGTFEGQADVDTLVVHPGGRCTGRVRAGDAEVRGNLEGDVRVKTLIRIRTTGSVIGNVRYGSLALEPGGELSAHVRNVPPSVSGDFELEVARGQAVRLTEQDVTAYDPDDSAQSLTFSVTRIAGGAIVVAGDTPRAASTFTQAELAAGQVLFQHDGEARTAGFDVVVSDAQGATSGAPRTVVVAVR